MLRPVPHHRDRSEGGQSTVEFALLAPMLVFAVMALLQVALVVRSQLAVEHAAREAVRVASVDPDASSARAAGRRVLPGARVTIGARPVVGEPITVKVSLHLVTDLPLVGAVFPDPDIRAAAVMRVER
ncbi:MAG: TadE/TadG family type IV pilus assembly protein [Acidimicrobiia bacterium]